MAGDNDTHDQLNLLGGSQDPPEASPQLDSSNIKYDLENIDSSDIDTRQGSVASLYPPSYSSQWEGESDKKGPEVEVYEFTPRRQTRSSTFASITKPAVKNAYGRSMRYILRSGTYASHISYERADPEQQNERSRWSGWRGGCLAAAISAGSILLLNVIFTIWAMVTSKSGTKIGTLHEGQCSAVSKLDSWLHIAINIMGTFLLGASNYTMQCLSSPTRKEIDAKHVKGQYLDIGLPSFRNLNGWRKKALFSLLVISTLPLHFLWNSAVFTTTQQLDYNVFVVSPNFFQKPTVDCSQNVTLSSISRPPLNPLYLSRTPLEYSSNTTGSYYGDSDTQWWQADVCSLSNELLQNSTQNILVRLSNEECINAYGHGNKHMSRRGNVLAVMKDQPEYANATIKLQFRYEMYVSNYTGDNWVCGPENLIANNYKCDIKQLAANASEWTLGPAEAVPEFPFQLLPTVEYPIDYCLSQSTELGGSCLLQYSLIIMMCVIVANTIKLSCMIFILMTQSEPVLATIGDAVASFLTFPDLVTEERPFLDRYGARRFKMAAKREPVRWEQRKWALRWWHAPSKARWFITVSLCTIAICFVIHLLSQANKSVRGLNYDLDIPSPYSLGFGVYHAGAALTWFNKSDGLTSSDFTSNTILIAMVSIANLPQVIVSCLYFAYNTVYTSMLSADEWSRFTVQRKALRTTDPVGEQRSTYWLSLPWTYGLPLAGASSLLHYLISQSLFIARTEILDTYGKPEPISYLEIAYSPLAILLALLFGSAMVLGMILNGLRKLKPCVLVANNSLAIAAACHRPTRDVGAELGKVSWGAVRHEGDGWAGHCCFTSENVEEPRVGMKYL